MSRFLANRFVEICGVITSLLTAALIVAIEHFFEFSFFTLTFWVVVPVGALITGCLAATGYYFGAILANRRPTRQLLVSIVVVAGATFFLIYYLQYRMLDVDGTPVSELVPFTTYLQIALTKAEYGLMRSKDTIEVGAFGYVIGLIHLAAFMVGGFGTYLALQGKPFCDRCEQYFKKVMSLKRTFADGATFEPFSTRLKSVSPPSAEYLHILKEPHDVPKPKAGAVAIEWELLTCKSCRNQMIVESAKVLNAQNNWSDVRELERQFKVDAGMPLEGEFRAAKTAR